MKYFLDFSLLVRNRNFGLLYIGQFVSFCGTMITSVAVPFQMYHLTQSTLMVGLVSLVQLIPLLFTALLGGVIADRHHRRQLLLIAEFLIAIGCLLLMFNASLATPHLWPIFVVAALMSALNGLHRPALTSILQQIVAKEDFPSVSALNNVMYSVCMIAGPAVGGLLIAHLGLVITYGVDFATYVVSLLAIFCMHGITKPEVNSDQSTWAALSEGCKYAWSRQDLLGSYFVDFSAMIFGMPNALFPAIAQHFGGPQVLGLLYAAPAVGALLISFFSGWSKQIKRHGVAIAISAALWGVAIIGFGLSPHLGLALIFLAIAGGMDAISGIFRSILWNDTIPNTLRGRLAGIEMISYLSGPKLGDTEAGLVAAAFGVTVSIVSGGILCIVGVAACCYLLPKFWHYKSEN